jgi:integrase
MTPRAISSRANLGRISRSANSKWLDENPAKRIKAPRNIRPEEVTPYTQAELSKILAACDKYPAQGKFLRETPKRLKALAREISDLANRARTRKLSPDEIQGGTFTISNNGSAGSVLTMPIINQPQVGIISTDAIVRRPVVAHTADGDEAIAIHPVGNLAMAWDHRAFDGAYAAAFLDSLRKELETHDWEPELA